MKNTKNENGRSMIEMLEKVKQPLNAVLRRQAQVFRCCQSALAPRSNTENQVTEAPLGARQRQCALAQSGRSMIEMLGVLAIIGVLSVGGIAGYSKAMMRVRINKTIEQITYMAGAIRTLFSAQGNYVGLSSFNTTLLKKAKLVPDEMWTEEGYSDGSFENPFGERVMVFLARKDDSDTAENRAFKLLSQFPQDACIELITQDWTNAGVGMMYIESPGSSGYVVPPVSIDKAITLCGSPSNIEFYFDVDVNSNHWKTRVDSTNSRYGW